MSPLDPVWLDGARTAPGKLSQLQARNGVCRSGTETFYTSTIDFQEFWNGQHLSFQPPRTGMQPWGQTSTPQYASSVCGCKTIKTA